MSEENPTPKEVLMAEFKAVGLNIAEDAAVSAAKAVFKAMPKIAAITENTIDDLLAPLIMTLEPKALEMLDKIDGEEG